MPALHLLAVIRGASFAVASACLALAQTVPHDVTLPDGHVSSGTRHPYQFVARGDVAVATEVLLDAAHQVVESHVHVLRRQSEGHWEYEQELGIAAAAYALDFDNAIAVADDTIVVATNDSLFPLAIFTHSNGAWSLPQMLPFPTSAPDTSIGSVHLEDARLVASEVRHLPSGHSEVHLLEYARTAGVWVLVSRSLVSSPNPGIFWSDDQTGDRYAAVYIDPLSFFGVTVTAAQRVGTDVWALTHTITNFGPALIPFDVQVDGERLYVNVTHAPTGENELRETDISTPGFTSFTTAIDSSWTLAGESMHVDEVRDGVAVVSARAFASGAKGRTVVYARRADDTWVEEFQFAADVPEAVGRTWASGSLIVQGTTSAAQPFSAETLDLHTLEFGTLLRGAREASVAGRGTQPLLLRAGEERGGWMYLVLGSMSGTAPGMSIGPGAVLPLADDPYFQQALWTSAPIAGAFGTLDADGHSAAEFFVPSGTSASFVGLSVHHAYVAIDPMTFEVHASNAVRVDLVP